MCCVVFFFLHSHLVRLHRCARILWLIMQSKPICAEHIHNTHLPRIVRNGFEVAILRFIHIPKKKSCNSIVAVTHDVLQSVDGVRFFRRFISLSLVLCFRCLRSLRFSFDHFLSLLSNSTNRIIKIKRKNVKCIEGKSRME